MVAALPEEARSRLNRLNVGPRTQSAWLRLTGREFLTQVYESPADGRYGIAYSRALSRVRRSGVHEIVREILTERGAL